MQKLSIHLQNLEKEQLEGRKKGLIEQSQRIKTRGKKKNNRKIKSTP